MIKRLAINNFKSIQSLGLDCRRVNIFIGRPNVGKSNILEALGLFSIPHWRYRVKDIVRFQSVLNLFHDEDVSRAVSIKADSVAASITFAGGKFVFSRDGSAFMTTNYTGEPLEGMGASPNDARIRVYRFAPQERFPEKEGEFLLPPDGRNLLFVLQTNKELRQFVSDLLREHGYRLQFKPHDNAIEIQKDIGDVIVSSPYFLSSDTLQRFIFLIAAVQSNHDAVIVLEEPEAHSFPYYTKVLAERIALDSKGNQYFISTHNPYFLTPLVAKTPTNELAVFLVEMKNHQTSVNPLSETSLQRLLDLDADVFFNFDELLESA